MDVHSVGFLENWGFGDFQFLKSNPNEPEQPIETSQLAPEHARDTQGLMRKADVAVYEARQAGQASWIYRAEDDPYKPERLALLGQFRRAIGAGEIVLFCQPKADLRTREIVGAEALVRWIHPELGQIAPDQFIPLIESTDLIHVLTRHMLQLAVRQCHAWAKEGVRIPIAVNLSARNLLERNLAASLTSLLRDWDGTPEWLDLEVTESSVMLDPSASIAELNGLRDAGMRIFLDDFGTGYSSLGYLMKLPIGVLKIDHGFTMNMLGDPGAANIVRYTIELAHSLGMKVVAEGTSSQDIWNALEALGCDEAQGHYISPPRPAAELLPLLRAAGWKVPISVADSRGASSSAVPLAN